MAGPLVVNTGFVETAKLITGVGSGAVFTYLALGASSAAEATTVATLASEIVENSGMKRASVTPTLASSSVASDTGVWSNTWTASATAGQSVNEAGIFNNAATNSGVMLAYATFAQAIPMSSADTLQVTWSVRVCPGA